MKKNLFIFHYRGAQVYAAAGRIYAEAECNASLLAIDEAHQFMWQKVKYSKSPGINLQRSAEHFDRIASLQRDMPAPFAGAERCCGSIPDLLQFQQEQVMRRILVL